MIKKAAVSKQGGAKRLRLSAEDSKARILAAALKLLAKHGWDATSFQMVADVCKTSQSNVLYHFNSKEMLLHGLIQNISLNNFRMVTEGLRPEHDALERIIVHFVKNLEWALEFPEEAQVIILVYSEGCHSKTMSAVFNQILRKAQARILEYVLAGVREKIFHLELEPENVAKILHNVLVGAFINILAGRLSKPDQYTTAEWVRVVKSLVGYRKSG